MRNDDCPSCGGTGTSGGVNVFGVLKCQRCAALYATRPIDKEAAKRLVKWASLRVVEVAEEDQRDFWFTFTDGSDVSGVYDAVSGEVVHYF